MHDAKWERWSALGGALFAVLIAVSALMPGTPPKTSDSAGKIAEFVGAIATFALLWFLGSVWRVLRRAEGGEPRLTVVAILGAMFAAVIGAVGSILLAVLGIVGVAGAGRANNLRVLYIVATNVGLGVVLGLAVFLSAFSIVIVRTGVLPRWLGWVGLLLAPLSLVSTGALASTHDVFAGTGVASFIGATLWLLVVSIMMFAGRGSAASESAT